MYARGQVFFVKILTFKNIYFLSITADLQETSQFYYFKYDKKIHCTGNPFIPIEDSKCIVCQNQMYAIYGRHLVKFFSDGIYLIQLCAIAAVY
jgi:hypothetical protein